MGANVPEPRANACSEDAVVEGRRSRHSLRAGDHTLTAMLEIASRDVHRTRERARSVSRDFTRSSAAPSTLRGIEEVHRNGPGRHERHACHCSRDC
jgi:hypothetical protein